ncbi:hypothetical protein Y032_0058g2846 [Ancylostoma ceylanicum]|uniref:Uncharacterized protein n=1 Tax=Ancylostoma ceylanicum TaxID=53326 RepID=A0A016U5D7_9BILA|nr:hypothetical protein Y032_0058g2846 [Ancylostoma ceylanicum]
MSNTSIDGTLSHTFRDSMDLAKFEPFRDFVDDPPIYLLATHLSCIYSVPVFVIAVYCIVYASPPAMGSMKWIQLIQVTW